jgi:hypothetical protein
MKIKVTFTVEVDPAAWSEEYGVDPDEVRHDVQEFFANAAHAHIEQLDMAPDRL